MATREGALFSREHTCYYQQEPLWCGWSRSSSYWLVYQTIKASGKKTMKKPRWVDLELPPSEKASWWRVDGYDTAPSSDEEDVEDNEDAEDNEEDDSEEDDDDEEGEVMDTDEE